MYGVTQPVSSQVGPPDAGAQALSHLALLLPMHGPLLPLPPPDLFLNRRRKSFYGEKKKK